MITTNGLNHLASSVKDPERSAPFYADLFKMEITSSSPDIAFLKTIGSTDMIALKKVRYRGGVKQRYDAFRLYRRSGAVRRGLAND